MPISDDDDELADAAADLIDDLRDQLRVKELEIEQLQAELRTSRVIGMALGILIASSPRMSEDQAHAALTKAARQGHRRLREVASEVVKTGALPRAD